MPPTTAGEVGLWLACAAAFIGVIVLALTAINQWRKLLQPAEIPPGREVVTRSELDRVEQSLKLDISRADASLKADIDRVDRETKDKIDKLSAYVRDRFHELGNSMNQMSTAQAAMPIEVRRSIDQALAPLIAKVDRQGIVLAQITARLMPPASSPLGEEENSTS